MDDVLPNLFIIGAAKAATTSVASMLATHPDVCMSRPKESHFFSDDRQMAFGLEYYRRYFQHHQHEAVVGDASTSYSRVRYYPAVPSLLKAVAPQARIVYCVRHPLERIEAAYVEHVCTPSSPAFESLSEALGRQPMIIDSSRYWEVFQTYAGEFGESNVRVVWFEEYQAQPQLILSELAAFMGIRSDVSFDFSRERRNSRSEVDRRLSAISRDDLRIDTSWNPRLRRQVVDLLRDDTRRFLTYFGRSLDFWPDMGLRMSR
jgi:hypothetical protein